MTLAHLAWLAAAIACVSLLSLGFGVWVLLRLTVLDRVDDLQCKSTEALEACLRSSVALTKLSRESLWEDWGVASRDVAQQAVLYQSEQFVALASWLGPSSKMCMLLALVHAFAAMHWQDYGEHGILGLSRAAVEAKALYCGLGGLTLGATASSLLLALRHRLGKEIIRWRSWADAVVARVYS